MRALVVLLRTKLRFARDIDGVLNAVSAIGPSDAWAAGSRLVQGSVRPLVEHWDGRSWKVVSGLHVSSSASLFDVVALGANNVWVVGSIQTAQGSPRPLIGHWDGQGWTRVPDGAVGDHESQLGGVTGILGGGLWAAGYIILRHERTLIERCC